TFGDFPLLLGAHSFGYSFAFLLIRRSYAQQIRYLGKGLRTHKPRISQKYYGRYRSERSLPADRENIPYSKEVTHAMQSLWLFTCSAALFIGVLCHIQNQSP